MELFEAIKNQRQSYYTKAGVNLKTPRAKNAFFPNWHPHQVTALDPFQSTQDFHNHLKGIPIKPLTCFFLSWYRNGEAVYQLALAAHHLLTLSPKKAHQHAINAIDSYCASFVYRILALVEILSQTISFLLRSVISIGVGLYHACEHTIGHLSSAKQDETNLVSAAFAL